MSKFQHEGGATVEAVQFWPEHDWPENVFEGIPGPTKEGEPPDRRFWLQVKHPVRATAEKEETRAEVHPIKSGEWVTTDDGGVLAVVEEEIFASEYRPA